MATLESRADRFRRLATMRTKSVIQRLRVLSNCANRQAYDYTEEDVKKIFQAIDEELRITRARFTLPKEKEFKL